MTFQDYGVVAEILASVATVMTLIYLTIQIRTASRAKNSQSRRAVHDRTAVLANTLGDSTETAARKCHRSLPRGFRARLMTL